MFGKSAPNAKDGGIQSSRRSSYRAAARKGAATQVPLSGTDAHDDRSLGQSLERLARRVPYAHALSRSDVDGACLRGGSYASFPKQENHPGRWRRERPPVDRVVFSPPERRRSRYQSGRGDSNSRRPAWEAGILPLNYARFEP